LADDPEDHTVRWELQQAPEGMTIDEDSGLVLWAPTTSDLGDHSVVVKAIDVYSASSTQPYTLTVTAVNQRPYFTSPPRTWASVSQYYAYHAQAKDPEQQSCVSCSIG
jgi:hypothetical protein